MNVYERITLDMLLKIVDTVILVFLLNALAVNCYSGSSTISKKNGRSRQKRILSLITDPAMNFYFEYNSCYALAAVVSVPLELPASRSVFFSYNFETNYYYAYFDNAQGLTPIPFTYIDEPGANGGIFNRTVLPPGYRQFSDNAVEEKLSIEQNKTEEMSDDKLRNKSLTNDSVALNSDLKEDRKSSTKTKQSKEEKAKIRKIRSILQNYFMSRRRFYKMVESKMDSSGMKGSECILKAICETSADSFKLHNGVIGSVVDVLFLPSASKDEKLPKRYYKAEANGKLRNCSVYNKACPKSLFDFITKII